jgi:UDP-glucose 4-epimerase
MLGRVGIVKKVFGNLVYQKAMSEYKEEYRIRDFYDSVNETER